MFLTKKEKSGKASTATASPLKAESWKLEAGKQDSKKAGKLEGWIAGSC